MDSREIQELVEAVEDEVNNGGFHQFFYNNAGDNTEETIQALEAIGATRNGRYCEASGGHVSRSHVA